MAIADYCMAFATATCNRLGACGALPVPVPQCTGELQGLCMQRASQVGMAIVHPGDAANCFNAIGSFGCRDLARAHQRGRVLKACTHGSLKPLFQP
jgi:hypothetical protein